MRVQQKQWFAALTLVIGADFAHSLVLLAEEEDGALAPRSVQNLPENRAKAQAYQKGDAYIAPPLIRILPRTDPSKPITNREHLELNRSKAQSYQRGDDYTPQTQILITPSPEYSKPTNNQEHLESNRYKAMGYMKGDSQGVFGADGLLIVTCRDTGSVAGRIGDDSRSGNVINTIDSLGRQIKVRCK